jgi:intracellular septation protein
MTKKPQLNPFLKLVLDLGPLALFFFTTVKYDIFVATAAFMVAVIVALVVTYVMTRRLPIMPLVTVVIVIVFGGLTLILHNDTFVKIKATIIYVLFAGVLLGGLAFNKPLLGVVFDSVFHLTEEGWRKLTWRWALFFILLAVANEAARRMLTTEHWALFKFAGVTTLTFLFSLLQMPLVKRYAAEPAAE